MFKKAISLLLSLMLIVTSLSVTIISVSAADGSVYKVAGVDALTGDGPTWQPDASLSPDNVMTAKEDGTYEKVYTDVAVMNDYQIKVVENTADGNFNWYGVDGGEDNFTFNVKSVCDVTITFNPETLKITVTGDGVEIPTELVVESMRAVGNGDGNWLNGVGWDPAADDNLMTEVAPKVYEITYTDLDEFDNYQVKFAANGSWAANWGGVYEGSGVESQAVFNTNDNITVEVPYELADVTLRLDLSNFDYATKQGAKFTVTVTDKSEVPETTVPETTVPETTAPVEATTAAPAGVKVNATSNYFPAASASMADGTQYVTVTYFMDSAKDMLNCQWILKYDPSVLKYDAALNRNGRRSNIMPQVDDLVVNDIKDESGNSTGSIKGNATSLYLYEFAGKGRTPFVTVTFEVIGSGETTVDLFVDVLTLSTVDPETFQTVTENEEEVVNFGVEKDTPTKPVRDTVVYAGLYNPDATTAPETTVPETTAPETTVPETTAPETTVPETTAPETTVPETTAPETTAPETTVPETTAPETTAPVGDAVYVVAGVAELCGTTWDPSPVTSAENIMTANGDGTFSIVYNDVTPMDSYQFKVVENIGETQNWYGIDGGNDNVTFNVKSECDVTITFDLAAMKITVTGDGVEIPTDLVVDSMRAVGNGDGNWLNGVAWDPAADENLMTEVAPKVYEITYTDLDEFDNYQVKFAANGSWAANWGGTYAGSDVVSEAVFNTNDNITVDVPYELADVTLRLDLTNFDYATKQGATFTVTVTDKSTPVNGLNITGTSNFFPEASNVLTEQTGTDLVTVTYYFNCDKKLLNTQWALIYDEEVLELVTDGNYMPFATNGVTYDTTYPGIITGSASDLGLYDIENGQPFVQVTFKALATEGETVVDLQVEDLFVSEENPATGNSDETKEVALVVAGQLAQAEVAYDVITEVTFGAPVVPETTVPETTVPETTAPETTAPETTVPETTAPETTVPETTAPETTAPETTAPETTAPVEPDTTAPVEPDTTVAPTDAPSTDATGATGSTVKPATSDTTTSNGTTNSGAVQTGNASMAVIILLVLVSACGVLYFTRKRVK